MKLYMLRTVLLSIISSLLTVHLAMVYIIQVCRQLSSRTSMELCSIAVYKLVWHIQLLSVQWINSWWWTDKLSETCRVSWQNRFVKIVHLVGFIIKKFVTIHGHMNVKFVLKVLAIWEQGGTSLCKWNNSASLCTVENSWWWAEKMSETCRGLWQNKFG